MAKTAKYYGTGRRKKSIARVYLVPGKGDVVINKRSMDDYFGLETLKVIVRQPLVATETADKFDVLVTVRGGGYTGQAGAIRHGIARALLTVDNDYRPVLKKAGSPSPERKPLRKGADVLERWSPRGLQCHPHFSYSSEPQRDALRKRYGSHHLYIYGI